MKKSAYLKYPRRNILKIMPKANNCFFLICVWSLLFDKDTDISSVESLWKTADWHEREAYDMMGIKFINHPDMKRILLPQDWEGHPLKKDYEVADYYHGMYIPKDKTSWE